MSKKNNDIFSEVIVGVFMVAVLALLVYFTIVISGVDLIMGREKTAAKIAFSDVGGLKERDNVVYRGMKVGTVEHIALAPSNILVTVKIDRDVVLRESCNITVAAVSLLGGNYLQMEEGAGKVLPLATTTFHGEPPVDWIRDLGQVARQLNDLTSQGSLRNIVSNFEETTENLKRVIARVERGEGTVGKLLSTDDTVYNDLKGTVADARKAVVSVQQTFDNVSVIADRLKKGEGTIGRLLSTNDTLYVDLKTTMANASSISERLKNGEGTIGKLLSKDDALWTDLKASIANIRETTDRFKSKDGLVAQVFEDKSFADDARKLVSNLKEVSTRLEQGKGTLGKLTTESAMYDEISALIKDVRQIVDNYRDTTPITTFGSLATGAL